MRKTQCAFICDREAKKNYSNKSCISSIELEAICQFVMYCGGNKVIKAVTDYLSQSVRVFTDYLSYLASLKDLYTQNETVVKIREAMLNHEIHMNFHGFRVIQE